MAVLINKKIDFDHRWRKNRGQNLENVGQFFESRGTFLLINNILCILLCNMNWIMLFHIMTSCPIYHAIYCRNMGR